MFYCILFIYLHAVKRFQVLICITNNSIKHPLLVYTQFNDLTVPFLAIQFSMSFVCTQFKRTYREDPIRCYHSRSELTLSLPPHECRDGTICSLIHLLKTNLCHRIQIKQSTLILMKMIPSLHLFFFIRILMKMVPSAH